MWQENYEQQAFHAGQKLSSLLADSAISLTLWVIGNRNIITDSRSDMARPRRR